MKNLKSLLPEEIINSLKSTKIYNKYRLKRLLESGSLSQAGQDFWVINEVFNQKKQGFFVEIGAADGLNINNTYLLEKKYNWNGICVEANPSLFKNLQQNRNCTLLNICVDECSGEVKFHFNNLLGKIINKNEIHCKIQQENIVTIPAITLKEILDENNAPKIIDYLSMDVEGAETRILRNFPFNEYCFLAVTIERPSEELQKIFYDNDYSLVKMIPNLDYYYIHKSYLKEYDRNLRRFYRSQYMPKLLGIF